MKWRDLLEHWGLSELKLTWGFAELTFAPRDPDRNAAWDLYVELATRVTTQPLYADEGDERAALESVHQVFALTRSILKEHRGACEFAKIALVVLNEALRPFTARWHPVAERDHVWTEKDGFRTELAEVQVVLTRYARLLGEMAQVGADLIAPTGRAYFRALERRPRPGHPGPHARLTARPLDQGAGARPAPVRPGFGPGAAWWDPPTVAPSGGRREPVAQRGAAASSRS